MQSTETTLQPQQDTRPFVRPAGHGPVHIDKNHAVIIPQAKAGDTKNSLLQIPIVLKVEGLEEKDFQTFRNDTF